MGDGGWNEASGPFRRRTLIIQFERFILPIILCFYSSLINIQRVTTTKRGATETVTRSFHSASPPHVPTFQKWGRRSKNYG